MSEHFELFKNVLKMEAESILAAENKLTADQIDKLKAIFKNLHQTGGKLLVTGLGKSGNIGRKISSTFTSLGLSSIFIHPVEALHGDLGNVSPQDAIILISKSGNTEEILKMMPFLSIKKEYTIGLLGEVNSSLAEKCGLVFDCSVPKEACINNQAPTTSSTLALAMGDAMAVFYESLTGLSREQFAENHPGGLLGKMMLLKVKDLLIPKDDCPSANGEESLYEVLLKMTSHPVGLCPIVENQKLIGIVMEGDIRRALAKDRESLNVKVSTLMTTNPISIGADQLAYNALSLMEKNEKQKQIYVLPVTDHDEFLGVIRMHDLIKEGF